MQSIYTAIKEKTEEGSTDVALSLVEEALKSAGRDAYLYYLKGNIHMKGSNWTAATNSYLQAERLDADSPAREKLAILREIMNFYNKDMYNQ